MTIMYSDDSNNHVDTEQMHSVAEDALSIFRINIFIIGVYLSVIALFYRADINIAGISESVYTIAGILIWLGSITSSIISYRAARLVSAIDADESTHGLIPPDRQIVDNVSGAALGSLIVVVALSAGVFEGVASIESLPLEIWVLIVILGLGAVATIQFGLRIIFVGFYGVGKTTSLILSYILYKSGIEAWLYGNVQKLDRWLSPIRNFQSELNDPTFQSQSNDQTEVNYTQDHGE